MRESLIPWDSERQIHCNRDEKKNLLAETGIKRAKVMNCCMPEYLKHLTKWAISYKKENLPKLFQEEIRNW